MFRADFVAIELVRPTGKRYPYTRLREEMKTREIAEEEKTESDSSGGQNGAHVSNNARAICPRRDNASFSTCKLRSSDTRRRLRRLVEAVKLKIK